MRQAMAVRWAAGCVGLWAAMAATPAAAQEEMARLNQRFWVQLGAFQPKIESHVQVDDPSKGISGTDIHFENLLGLPERKTLPTLLLGTRLDDRWRIEFEHFSLKRSSSRTASGTIRFDDTDFDGTAVLSSEFSSKVYRLSAGYSFYKTSEAEVGAVLGLHLTDFKIALEGQGSVDGSVVAQRAERKEKAVPLPTIGAYGAYAFAPHWEASGRVDVLSLKVKQYKGTLINAQANVFYRFTPQVAVGLGYRYDDYTVKASRNDWSGKLEYQFRGPQLVLDAGF